MLARATRHFAYPQAALASVPNDVKREPETGHHTAYLHPEARRQGLDGKRNLSLRSREKCFSLDIPSPRTWLETPFEPTN